MNLEHRKQQFLDAVRILAPDDLFIQQTAQRVAEEALPAFPGGAALEFVAALNRLREPPNPAPKRAGKDPESAAPAEAGLEPDRLSLSHAVRVRSAEFWLKLGEPDEALRELERVSKRVWNHPSVLKARLAAARVMRERDELTVQE